MSSTMPSQRIASGNSARPISVTSCWNASRRRTSSARSASNRFERGLDDVFAQRVDARDRRVFQREIARDRQLTARLLDRFAQRPAQQRDDAGAMRFARFVGALEHAQRDAFAEIDERRKRRQSAFADQRDRGFRRNRMSATSSRVSSVSARRENAARAAPVHCGADRGEIAAFGERLAALVVDAEAHAQMRRQLDAGEIARGDLDAGDALEIARERDSQRLVARRFGFGERAREIRRGHEIAAQRLRQAADQLGDFFRQQSRHQPFAARTPAPR